MITATRAKLTSKLTKILAAAGRDAGKQVKDAVKKHRKLHKDDSDDEDIAAAATVASELDLDKLNAIIDATAPDLKTMATDSGARALSQIGVVDQGDLVNQVYEDSADYAATRSAELIGMKYVNGKLVDNPDAEWSITSATRDQLRGIIADAFAGKTPAGDVEASIADAGAFSPERAALIARTEISRANNYGALSGYITARDQAGVAVKKSWLPDDEACPICVDNVDDGIIDLDDEFSSGDLAPPAHPNCECTILPVTDQNDE